MLTQWYLPTGMITLAIASRGYLADHFPLASFVLPIDTREKRINVFLRTWYCAKADGKPKTTEQRLHKIFVSASWDVHRVFYTASRFTCDLKVGNRSFKTHESHTQIECEHGSLTYHAGNSKTGRWERKANCPPWEYLHAFFERCWWFVAENTNFVASG